MGGRASATQLLQMPEVQKELSITDDQKTQIKTTSDEIRQQFQQGGQGGQGGGFNRNMTQEERTKFFADMQTRIEKIAKDTDDKLSKILTPEQMTRLKQLQVQYEGVNALTTTDVTTKLKISDDQKTKIQKVIEDARSAQRGQGRGQFNPNATDEERKAAADARREARAKTLKDAQAVLDDDQLVQWGDMTGKEFKFPDNNGRGGNNFGGGGRGGRGGRGGGGGNGGGGNGGGGNAGGGGASNTGN
jgi:hypothetical protein